MQTSLSVNLGMRQKHSNAKGGFTQQSVLILCERLAMP